MKKYALVTAGPTREYLDPVRFMSNKSSGQMGYLIAKALNEKGYAVTILSGPVNISVSQKIPVIKVESAVEMADWVKRNFDKFNVIVSCAAVADYRPVLKKKSKIKSGETLNIRLVKNPDILTWLGKNKKKSQLLVGFALEEPSKLKKDAQRKLRKKNCDIIVANPIETMESAVIKAQLFFKNGRYLKTSKMTKEKFARLLANEIFQLNVI